MSEKCGETCKIESSWVSYIPCVQVAVKMQGVVSLVAFHYVYITWLSQLSETRFTKTCLKLPDVLYPLPNLERTHGENLVNETKS